MKTPAASMSLGTGASPGLHAIDLFSGCGGLSVGFEKAEIVTDIAVDNWSDALNTFEKNHKKSRAIQFDLGSGDLSPLMSQLKDVDIIFGGPPCQGFSISGKRDPNDPRNLLYRGFYEIVAEISPEVFVMENVPNLASMDQGRLIHEIEQDFSSLGYTITRQILLASDFGVPQNRRRLILVGTKSGIPFTMPTGNTTNLSEKITCLQAIGDLPEGSLPNGAKYTANAFSEYQQLMRVDSAGVFNHEITNHSEQTKNIINLVPDGGNYKNLPTELQKTRNVNIAWTRYSSSKPSLTIDTGHRHHFHYKFNRIPTVRESARLQSFSDDFIFEGSKTSQYKQVGNAVPPLMAAALGNAISEYLGNVNGRVQHAIRNTR